MRSDLNQILPSVTPMKGASRSSHLKHLTTFTLSSKKIVSTLLKPYQALLEEKHIVMKATTVISLISKAKAKRDTAADYMKKLQANQKSKTPFSDIDFMVAEIYEKYEQSLRQNNSLDFDDLLLYGVELFTRHKYTAAWCKHVLVDEL